MAFNTFLGSSKKGDPLVYVELVGKKRAIVFDCGESSVTNSWIKKISDIFISHTHMDHFIGFDKILRVNIIDDRTIRIFGPPGIIKNVEGKLASYTWNITDQLRLKLEVIEIRKNTLQRKFYNSQYRFKSKKLKSVRIKNNIIFNDDNIEVKFEKLDHKIPCFAYSVTEKQLYSVRKDKLVELNFDPGPWLGELKNLVGHNANPRKKIEVAGELYAIGYLKKELLIRRKGMKLTYVTDVLCNRENTKKIVSLAKNSTYFFCESFFLDEDKARAKETFHLTALQCARLAKRAKVRTLIPFHISKRYRRADDILNEVKKIFSNIK